ncbi:MAG: MAPEG family protein [Pseudomonadales bacterium]|jgi:uncharacterized MAPEG superfamily protein
MTIPMWSLLAGMFLPYIWAFGSLPFRLQQFADADFRHPRQQVEKLVDAGNGVVGVQFNAWEALTFFAVANLIAFMSGLDAVGYWSMAAMIWVVARFFHGVFYVANIPALRMICFATGLGMSLWIVFMAANV